MEPSDLTVTILKEIRDEVRGTNSRIDKMNTEMNVRFSEMNFRFEVIETTLKDLAEQMVMLARGVKGALEVRSTVERRLDDHERRLADLEKH